MKQKENDTNFLISKQSSVGFNLNLNINPNVSWRVQRSENICEQTQS